MLLLYVIVALAVSIKKKIRNISLCFPPLLELFKILSRFVSPDLIDNNIFYFYFINSRILLGLNISLFVLILKK